MKQIAWAQLMQLGLVELRLAPEVFWDLTPAELMLIAGAGASGGHLNRAGLADLVARFPDRLYPTRETE